MHPQKNGPKYYLRLKLDGEMSFFKEQLNHC